MSGADLVSIDLDSADLSRADLTSADLAQANLSSTILAMATLTGVQSSSIVGVPASLPLNWSVKNGYLTGPGAFLNTADLIGVNLSHLLLTGADLSNADLSGANLADTDLTSVSLTGSNLGGANLTGTTLAQVLSGTIAGTPSALPAHWKLTGGFLLGPGSDLHGADLVGLPFAGTDLVGADLSGANLVTDNISNVSFANADLAGADLENVTATKANLSEANLTGINLSGDDLAHASFAGADLTNASLPDTNVSGASFAGATLTGVESTRITGTPSALPSGWTLQAGFLIGKQAVLTDADLDNLDLHGADLSGAGLTSASLRHVILTDADLHAANLTGANFSFATLTGADLSNASLASANFSFANLAGASLSGASVTQAMFPQAIWSNTTCPDGSNSNKYVDGCFSQLDTQAPTASPVVKGTAGSAGWFTSKVTVDWNWADNGVINSAACTRTSTSGTSGMIKLTASCADQAGNKGSASTTVKVDTTAPAVTLTGVAKGRSYAIGNVPAPQCKTTDAVSGVASPAKLKVVSVGSAGLGSFTATCTGAVSVAGTAQAGKVRATYSVDYGFAGFLSPRAGTVLRKSAHQITVSFRLDNAAGKPVSAQLGKSLTRSHAVRVVFTGPNVGLVKALCEWIASDQAFSCTFKTPAGVRVGPAARYTITASENLDGIFELAPVLGKAVNPEVVHFR